MLPFNPTLARRLLLGGVLGASLPWVSGFSNQMAEPPTPPGLRLTMGHEPMLYQFKSGFGLTRLSYVAVGRDKLGVLIPLNVRPELAARMLRFAGYAYAYLPAKHRSAVKGMAFEPAAVDVPDKYKGLKFGTGKTFSPAEASEGYITIKPSPSVASNDGYQLDLGTFFHEVGHCVALQQFGTAKPPASWERAAKRDGNFPSEYAKAFHGHAGEHTEDFADAFAMYQLARLQPPDSGFYKSDSSQLPDFEYFGTRFPFRTYELARLLNDDYSQGWTTGWTKHAAPVTTPGASPSRPAAKPRDAEVRPADGPALPWRHF